MPSQLEYTIVMFDPALSIVNKCLPKNQWSFLHHIGHAADVETCQLGGPWAVPQRGAAEGQFQATTWAAILGFFFPARTGVC